MFSHLKKKKTGNVKWFHSLLHLKCLSEFNEAINVDGTYTFMSKKMCTSEGWYVINK